LLDQRSQIAEGEIELLFNSIAQFAGCWIDSTDRRGKKPIADPNTHRNRRVGRYLRKKDCALIITHF